MHKKTQMRKIVRTDIVVGAYFEWGGTRFWGAPITMIGAQKRAAPSWILGPIYSLIGA